MGKDEKIEIFPWSEEQPNDFLTIQNSIVCIDITFSKKIETETLWYNSKKYKSSDDSKFETDIKTYDNILSVFKNVTKKVPIDYITDNEKKQTFFDFSNSGSVSTSAINVVEKINNWHESNKAADLSLKGTEKFLSDLIFESTSIKQILVFPNITSDGFGSFCIVTLHSKIGEGMIYKLLAEVNRYSYRTAIDEYNKSLREEAIKSAKAAIMSRNLSHNLGSHVMSYLKHSLNSVADIEKSGALREAYQRGTKVDKELPYLVGTGRFISYLQERQDYIATVSTDYIPYPATVNFKDCIYDELNPDYRYERHSSEWSGNKPANILLENIARSEGLTRKAGGDQEKNNIILKYRNFNGLDKDNKEDYDTLRTWNFSLPGGIMGRQGVFSIVENVIRNAAKHGKRDAGENLEITFDIIDPLCHVDKLKKIEEATKKDYQGKKDISDLYVVTLTANTKVDEGTLRRIQDAINEDLGDSNLKNSNKGLKEMKISASWLRSIRIEELTEEEIKNLTPILEAHTTKDDYLQYVFCLPRVKNVALIVEKDWTMDEDTARLWKTNGWYVFTWENYIKEKNKNFDFVILSKNLRETKVEFNGSEKYVRKIVGESSSNRFFVEADYTNLSKQEMNFNVSDCAALKSNEDFDKELTYLYMKLADVGENDDSKIAISDPSVEDDKIKTTHVVNIQSLQTKENSLHNYKYIYRKHNDTKKEFEDLKRIYSQEGVWSNMEFVEGITGGNSTDRLVRHNIINDLWAYKHLHAMKTKVAIFDERLFANTTGVELSKLQSAHTDWRKRLEEDTDEEARKKVIDFDKRHDNLTTNDINLYKKFKDSKKEDVISFAEKYYSRMSEFPTSELFSIVTHKKKIDLYTLTQSDNEVIIWGVNFDSYTNSEHYGNIEAVGKIAFEKTVENDLKIIVMRYGEFNMMYDYISLHQGLLDKIYESFPKKTDIDTCENRLKVTQEIYKSFVNPKVEETDFLHGMVIHSGRSKPNKKDMPQRQPFLQYSAIENAFFDCKYTLVEVLDFSCFENYD